MKYLQKRAVVRAILSRFDRNRSYRQAVVIPALSEADHLPLTIESLHDNVPKSILDETLILIVVNNRPIASAAEADQGELQEWIENNALTLKWLESRSPDLPYPLAWIDASSPGNELPTWGGVGLARKIGCDSILAFLLSLDKPILPDFVFFSLDADTLVSPDYIEIASDELRRSRRSGGTIPFRHQRANSPDNQAAIDAYEAFLNYYVDGLRWAGSPYAFHTIGSCLCFTADGYIRAGGFPARRRAGEDFYFCMELAKTGGICEIKNTAVYPSPRISRRVPFGTGKSMADAAMKGKNEFPVYDFRVFASLRELLTAVSAYADDGAERIVGGLNNFSTREFLEGRGFFVIWDRFQRQYKTKDSLVNAFHRWFDGFVTLKYIHFLTEKVWPRKSLKDNPGADFLRDHIN